MHKNPTLHEQYIFHTTFTFQYKYATNTNHNTVAKQKYDHSRHTAPRLRQNQIISPHRTQANSINAKRATYLTNRLAGKSKKYQWKTKIKGEIQNNRTLTAPLSHNTHMCLPLIKHAHIQRKKNKKVITPLLRK